MNIRFKISHKCAASRCQYRPIQLWGNAYLATAPFLPKNKMLYIIGLFMIFFILYIYGILYDDIISSDCTVITSESVISQLSHTIIQNSPVSATGLSCCCTRGMLCSGQVAGHDAADSFVFWLLILHYKQTHML